MSDPIVEVAEGKLKGKVTESVNGVQYYIFKGIPYAKPPVNELRFAIPLPPEKWKGIRDATKECNICAQYNNDIKNILGDEDCLYLNVCTLKLSKDGSSPVPVMVFLHGGGFVFGNGTDEKHHGMDLLVEKDMVVVSLNYRVAILGFLSLGIKEAPGNMGLRDQVMALEWVQRNISKFGGDPNNVTLFGFSAGAASVEYLMLSPMARGLFHKAAAHSGSSLCHWACNNQGKTLAYKIPELKKTKITDDESLLTFLKELPIQELLNLTTTISINAKERGGIFFGYVPCIEKSGDWQPFLDECSYSLLSQGKFAKVPFITGFTDREGLLAVVHNPESIEKLTEDKKFADNLPFPIDDIKREEIEKSCKNIYLEKPSKFKDNDAWAIDFFTDVDFVSGVYVAAKLMAKTHSPVFMYEFTYDGSLNYLKRKLNITEKLGACHGDDNGYLITSDILPKSVSATDKLVRERMIRMWANFAMYGDPTYKLDDVITTKWQSVSETGLHYLQIDENLTMHDELYPERMKLYEELYKKQYS